MKPNALEEEIDLSELVKPPPTYTQPAASEPPEAAAPLPTPPLPAPPPAASAREFALQQKFSSLLDRIPKPLQKGTLHILIELQLLLRHLELIEEAIKQEPEPCRIVSLFEPIHGRASSLVDKTNALAAQAVEGDEALATALEGISFALRHELSRVFERESQALKGLGTSSHSRSELTRYFGILQNCFQQSTITLAQAFDPALDGEEIFEDYRIKQEQSIILRRELALLLQKLQRVEEGSGILQKLYFINSLKQFQKETMQFLIHRDWEEFEGFVREIVETYDEMGNMGSVFHRFTSYLETLLKHVGMRAVLSDKPFREDGKTLEVA